MVKDRSDWIFFVLVAVLLGGMALTVLFGTAKSNHSYVTRDRSSMGR
jgi:hypothetical protein